MFRSVISARTSSNHRLGAAIFLGLLAFCVSLAIWSPQRFEEDLILSLLVTLLALLMSGWTLYAMLVGKQWELVVDDSVIRWGPTRKRNKHKIVYLRSISCLRFTDYDNNCPYELITRAGVRHGIPAFLLLERDIENDLLGYFRAHLPAIMIDLSAKK